jgi:hypothetical protein
MEPPHCVEGKIGVPEPTSDPGPSPEDVEALARAELRINEAEANVARALAKYRTAWEEQAQLLREVRVRLAQRAPRPADMEEVAGR